MGCFDFWKKEKEPLVEDYGDEFQKMFLFMVDDVFSIRGRGMVVTGTVLGGSVHEGQRVLLVRRDGSTREVMVKGIEKFKQGLVKSAEKGENVGLLLEELTKDDIGPGDILKQL